MAVRKALTTRGRPARCNSCQGKRIVINRLLRTQRDFEKGNSPGDWRRAWLAALPSLGGLLGALVDEQRNLGFTNWRAACRSAGPSLQSLLIFTRELLPSAIVGVLAGAFAVVLFGIVARRAHAAQACFAAHLGCLASMPLMLAVCAFASSPAVMLVTDVVLAALAAELVARVITRRQRAAAAHP